MKINVTPTGETTTSEGSLFSIKPGTYSAGVPATVNNNNIIPEKPKKKRKTKVEKLQDGTEVVSSEEDIPFPQSSTPYHNTYAQTDAMLHKAINQLDALGSSMYEDLQSIRDSKTIRKKYDYITEINSAMVSSIQAKIGAIKEINASIKNSHDLDLKRMKELKLNEKDQDDARSIMDAYKAFISTPVSQNVTGPFMSPLGANTLDLSMAAYNPNVQVAMMGQNPEIAYNNYVNNMSPEHMMMMIEDNPNINHVIAYDPSTGAADFAIYDRSTGQFLQGIPTRNRDMYMDNMNFNFQTMQAHSNDLNETFEIIYTSGVNMNNPAPIEQKPEVTTSSSGKDMSNY